MSLADELLADLEDVGEEAADAAEESDAADDVIEDVISDVTMQPDTSQLTVESIAKLLHSEEASTEEKVCCSR